MTRMNNWEKAPLLVVPLIGSYFRTSERAPRRGGGVYCVNCILIRASSFADSIEYRMNTDDPDVGTSGNR